MSPPDADKLAAFHSYDFDGSAEFQGLLRNVELPVGAAAGPALTKVKAKFYKRAVDPDFDPAWLPSVTGAAPPPAPPQQQQQQQSTTSAAAAAGRHSGTGAPAGRPPQPTAQRSGSVPQSWKLCSALLSAVVLVLAPLVLLPLVPRLSRWAWRRLTLALLARQLVAVVSAHGSPGTSLHGLRIWATRLATASDGHYALLALGLVMAQPFAPLLTPFLVSCAYGLLDYCAAHHAASPLWSKYGVRAAALLGPHAAAARAATARAEQLAGLGLLAGLLLPGRQPALAMLTWHFLRLRYWSPDAAVLHRQAWAQLGAQTAGLRARFPITQRAVDVFVRWFAAGARR